MLKFFIFFILASASFCSEYMNEEFFFDGRLKVSFEREALWDTTYNGRVVFENLTKDQIFLIEEVSFSLTSQIKSVWEGAERFVREGERVTIFLKPYCMGIYPGEKDRKVGFNATISGNIPYPKDFQIRLLRTDAAWYPESIRLHPGWRKKLVENEEEYYKDTWHPIPPSLFVNEHHHPTQLWISQSDTFPMHGFMYTFRIPDVQLAMVVGFIREVFGFNPNFMLALVCKETSACLYSEGKWWWEQHRGHPDGPFQVTAPAFEDIVRVLPYYFDYDISLKEYPPGNLEEYRRSLFLEDWIINNAIVCALELTYIFEFLANAPAYYLKDFLEHAKDPLALCRLVHYCYNVSLFASGSANVLKPGKYRFDALTQKNLSNPSLPYALIGYNNSIPQVIKAMTILGNRKENLYDPIIKWEKIEYFLKRLRLHYPNGIPTEGEWQKMVKDIRWGYDTLSKRWKGEGISLRYDWVTIVRIMKEHLPYCDHPPLTSQQWVWNMRSPDSPAVAGRSTPPSISLLSPKEGEILEGRVRLLVKAEDDYGVREVKYRIKNVDKKMERVGDRFSAELDTLPLEDGPLSLLIEAEDNTGLVSGIWVSFLVANKVEKDYGSLAGRVQTEEAKPLEGVVIKVSSGEKTYEGSTDKDGRYLLSGLHPGKYEVFAEKEGFRKEKRSVHILKGEVMRLDFVLKKEREEGPIVLALNFLKEKLMHPWGGIYFQYRADVPESEYYGAGHQVISETTSLALLVAANIKDKEFFDSQIKVLNRHLSKKYNVLVWKLNPDGTFWRSPKWGTFANAPIDDLRAIRALLHAYETWGEEEYLSLAKRIAEGVRKANFPQGIMVDWFSWEDGWSGAGDRLTLGYIDLYTMKRLSKFNPQWEELVKKHKEMLLSAQTPSGLFHQRWDLKKGEAFTEAADVEMIFSSYCAENLARFGKLVGDTECIKAASDFLSFVKEEYRKRGKIHGRYNIRTLEPTVDWWDLAVYSIITRCAKILGEEEFAQTLIEKAILPWQNKNRESKFYGSFGWDSSPGVEMDALSYTNLQVLEALTQKVYKKGEGILKVFVFDAFGKKILNAQVKVLEKEEKLTSSNGYYTISLEPGSYTLTVIAPLYLAAQTKEKEVRVKEGKSTEVKFWMVAGDINADGTVDIQDIVLVASSFGKKVKEADINADGIVDIQDIVLCAKNFGKKVGATKYRIQLLDE